YDPPRELVAVALIGIVPCVVVVATGTPVRTAADLIAYARANRGRLSFSSSGIGNPQQLAGELMNSMAGTDVLHVPYRGAAPAVTDVATGAVTMSFSSLAAALPLIQDGRLRAVAVTSRERMPQLPDAAPLAEAAVELEGYELLNWFGLFAPAATPSPIVARLNEIVARGLRDKAISQTLDAQGIVPRIMTPAQYRDFVAAETEKFGKIVAEGNIKVENWFKESTGGTLAQHRAADVYQARGSRGHRAARRYRPSAAWSDHGTRARNVRTRVAQSAGALHRPARAWRRAGLCRSRGWRNDVARDRPADRHRE